jgi:hypothetical protein
METIKELQENALIGRTEIISKLGITRDKLYYALKHFAINMPKPKEAKRNGSGFKYNEAEIDAWVATDPLKDVTYIDPEKIAAKERAKNIGIDNSAVVSFVRAKRRLSVEDVMKKHLSPPCKPYKEELILRDDYTPPRSGLVLFRHG